MSPNRSGLDVISKVVGVILVFTSILGCYGKVALTVFGPPELVGASVRIDGAEVGKFRRIGVTPESPKGGALAELYVSVGRHTLEIQGTGFSPIVREIEYKEPVEDYLLVSVPQEASTGAKSPSYNR